MRRRTFLVSSCRASIGLSLLSIVGYAQDRDLNLQRAAAGDWEFWIADLEDQIHGLMGRVSVPGLSITVIRDAKLAWQGEFGFRNNESRVPVDSDTVFEAQSMSKPVFAYVVMKLCEKGTLDLDEPLINYTPIDGLETPLTDHSPEVLLKDDPRLALITARHILSHTAGFQNWRTEEEPLRIHFEPGEQFLYSGEGYSYLQSIVTFLAGQSIEPYMQANLFHPFEMTSSGYIWNDLFESRAALPHDSDGRPLDKFKPTEETVARYAAAGNLHTTATDYAKFLIEIIDPKPSDDFHLNRDSLAEMVRPHVAIPDDTYPSSWALGWEIQHAETGDLISHYGDNRGFHSFAVASLERGTGVVMMTNGENGAGVIDSLLLGDPIQRLV